MCEELGKCWPINFFSRLLPCPVAHQWDKFQHVFEGDVLKNRSAFFLEKQNRFAILRNRVEAILAKLPVHARHVDRGNRAARMGYWGDRIGLDPTSQEGWLTGGKQFWLMPAIFAVVVSVLFFATFWDKSEAAGGKAPKK